MKRSKFSLSSYKLLSCDMGLLVPINLMEVLPGDTFQAASSLLVRVSPLLAPVMHPVHIRIHHWFVPHRLVWENWEDFITGGPDGDSTPNFPTITFPIDEPSKLPDYYGVPPSSVVAREVSALPFRGYNLIFNEWYRDQDLQAERNVDLAAGSDTETNISMARVGWEKDYFTSARPWTQKGPEVTIPLSPDFAPVKGIGKDTQTYTRTDTQAYESDGTRPTYASGEAISATEPPTNQDLWWVQEDPSNPGYPNIRADLRNVTSASINDLRLAFALQRYEEARARYGSRYTEYLRYLGVRSSDARLQRPEYLGGGKQTIQFSEVLQTGVTTSGDDTLGVGNLRGHGIGAVRSNRFRRFFEEHGYIHSFMSVRPRTMYTQGLWRTFNRRTKEDFWQRELQHIGQQEVLNKELYVEHTTPDGVFGYQDRYDEYRRQESSVAGDFRSTLLDFWHMARSFTADPVLNASFVACNPTKRIHAVQTNDVLWVMANHNVQARRQLSRTGSSFIF